MAAMNTSSEKNGPDTPNRFGSGNSDRNNRKNFFAFLPSFLADRLQPPDWLVRQGQQQLVLFLNHVLMQEKAAQERLLRQKGRVVQVQWGIFGMHLVITPAGLVDLAPAFARPDLVLSVAAESPWSAMQSAMAGKRPAVSIEGDVQLAADIGWLADNLRWDAEEDLSRLIGDGPAHAVAETGRRLTAAIRQFLAQNPLASAAANVFGARDDSAAEAAFAAASPAAAKPFSTAGSDSNRAAENTRSSPSPAQQPFTASAFPAAPPIAPPTA
jgi:ubiquinone biosynthesis protein UbiJ